MGFDQLDTCFDGLQIETADAPFSPLERNGTIAVDLDVARIWREFGAHHNLHLFSILRWLQRESMDRQLSFTGLFEQLRPGNVVHDLVGAAANTHQADVAPEALHPVIHGVPQTA